MLAIILKNKEQYVSPVFAVKAAGWRSEVLAFDSRQSHIERIRMWSPHRQVFIVDWEDFEGKRKKWTGYDWVLDDSRLWKALRFRKRADISSFPEFGKYTGVITLPEWFEIRQEKDILSLMELTFGFHDSFLMRVDQNGQDIEIEFDTTWGCIVTVKFQGVRDAAFVDRIGIICDSELEQTDGGFRWMVTCFDSGGIGGVTDDAPFSGEPYIFCDNIKWNMRTGMSRYSGEKKYNTLDELYNDLKSVSDHVFLKDGQLILHHKNDTLVIEKSPKGYRTYFNGKQEKEITDDIFEHASDFLTQINPEDIEEEVLADIQSVKPLYIWHYMKYALFISVLWSALGLFLHFGEKMHWVLLAVLFLPVLLLVLICPVVFLIGETERRYMITPTKIYYFNGDVFCSLLYISEIKDIKLYRSLLKKGIGTIKIRQKNAITFGEGLIAVKEAEKIYKLINQTRVV